MAKQDFDPYENLANAIILQAVKDYRLALKAIKRNPDNRAKLDEALEIERFFRSDWYSVLTDVGGDFLIRKLQEEIRQSESIRGETNIFSIGGSL